ncbi:MAG: FtsW/RodA/SpoVE family cell cycle protein, partial [Clostridia bacterium]|nr:FtsW/RodA/SpoVE family cell cycle protein [Clostridia bacterium]
MARKVDKEKPNKLFLGQGKIDIAFLSFVLVLLTVGLVMLFSASYANSYTHYGNSFHFILRQTIFAALGLGVMFVT